MFSISNRSSSCDELLLVINFGVELIEVFDQIAAPEWIIRLFKICVLSLNLGMEFLPFLIQTLSLFIVLLHCILLLLLWIHLKSFIKSKRVNFL
jgi:hypothetical protein